MLCIIARLVPKRLYEGTLGRLLEARFEEERLVASEVRETRRQKADIETPVTPSMVGRPSACGRRHVRLVVATHVGCLEEPRRNVDHQNYAISPRGSENKGDVKATRAGVHLPLFLTSSSQ